MLVADNQDGVVSFLDIPAFIEILSMNGCQIVVQ